MSPQFPKPNGSAARNAGTTISHETLSVSELVERIVFQSDLTALAELHQRTLFQLNGGRPRTLVGLVDELRRQAQNLGIEQADRAYDLTVDKFSRLAVVKHPLDGVPIQTGRKRGVDCRRYYRAYLRHLARNRALLARLTCLEREQYEAKALLGLIRRHFAFSLREGWRSSFLTRYTWHHPMGRLHLRLPRDISGRARARWVKTIAPDADPTRPDEAQRIQAIIDAHVGQMRPASLEPHASLGQVTPWFSPTQIPGEDIFNVSVEGLANCVAREKAANIALQRPAIQALGTAKLVELIRAIFDLLTDDEGSLDELASRFGISKPTLSRFAGFRWNSPSRNGSAVPDLWRNTAQVIGSDPDFVEAAKHAGVWQRVETLANPTIGVVSFNHFHES